jgi:hypothetical protein
MSAVYDLYRKYDVGKYEGERQRYGAAYEHLLSPRRNSVGKLLEIGVLGGGSLRVWEEYFPYAEIHGVDIRPECAQFARSRVQIHIGSQDDLQFLESICVYGPFDVIIDDGSHQSTHQQSTLHALWPYLSPGGIYLIEDVMTGSYASYCPPGQSSTIDFAKQLLDDLMFVGEFKDEDSRRPSYLSLEQWYNELMIRGDVPTLPGLQAMVVAFSLIALLK